VQVNYEGSACGSKPVVSIVVTTYLSRDYAKLCVDAIVKNTPGPYELIFVDNNSDDGTLEYLQTLDAKVIANNHRLTKGQLLNQGAKEASGEFLLFLDDDTVPQQGWLDKLLEPFNQSPNVGVAGAKLVSPGLEDPLHYGFTIDEFDQPYPVFRRVPLELPPEPQETIAVSSSCMLIRRSILEKLDGFDEGFRDEHEDVDFCLRAHAAGCIIVFCPSSKVWHYEIETSSRLPFKDLNLSLMREKWNLGEQRRLHLREIGRNLVVRDYTENLERKITGLEANLSFTEKLLEEQQSQFQNRLVNNIRDPKSAAEKVKGRFKRLLKS